MANDNSNASPVADLVAIVPQRQADGTPRVDNNGDTVEEFVKICPLWAARSGTGNLSGYITAEPLAWKDPRVPRKILVQNRSRN